jgi:hypothetical protein
MAAKTILQVYNEILNPKNTNNYFIATATATANLAATATVLTVGHGSFDEFKEVLRQYDSTPVFAVFRIIALYMKSNVPSRRVHPVLFSIIGSGVTAVAKAHVQTVGPKVEAVLPGLSLAFHLDVTVDTLWQKGIVHELYYEVEGADKPVHYDFSGMNVVRMNQPPTEFQHWSRLVK